MPLNDTGSFKQQKAIKEHSPNHLSSKVLPSHRQQNMSNIWAQKYKEISSFTIIRSAVPPNYLSGQLDKLSALIYDRMSSMHRYGEQKQKIEVINLSKPTGHVMHQQFNIQQL